MDKTYDHKKFEKDIYSLWEESDAFKPKIIEGKKPFTIILPPPNASGKMHIGNVLMIALEDLLVRWHRMMGEPVLWIPGTDHAGFETQTTFERELKKEGKSRLDYDRDTLYKMIWDFVQKNKGLIERQIKEMGASVDWSRLRFTLDDESVKVVYSTFKKMFDEGLIYRGNHLVNYSFKWGTTFSDAEIRYKEQVDPLYYVKYFFADKKSDKDFLTVATVRPETIMVDTHLAVNPKSAKNKKIIGKKVLNPITQKTMEIIADPFVDDNFGAGVVKLTPAHDKNDYEVALKHKLPVIQLIETNGKLNNNAGQFKGMKILQARQEVVSFLRSHSLIDKIEENYVHQVPVDYRSGDYIENLILPNWFVKVDDSKKSLKKPAYEAVKKGVIKIYPKWREITYLRWMETMRDWPISRQIVWGIRIPAWLCQDCNEWTVTDGSVPKKCTKCNNNKLRQDPDTFDTWFSSGQWPLITTGYLNNEKDFKYFYPTSVLETGWDIVTRWVSRMVMFGYYLTGQPPFRDIYLHGIVRAIDGQKMSKSKGNVINPEEHAAEFGTDALRMGLIAGTANGKDFNFPQEKIVGYKKFANKLWNIARFTKLMQEENKITQKEVKSTNKDDVKILQSLNKLIKSVNQSLEKFRFSDAADNIYQFIWHELADIYLESIKSREDKEIALNVMLFTLRESLKLLHPFMPFITEAIYQKLFAKDKSDLLITSSWPA